MENIAKVQIIENKISSMIHQLIELKAEIISIKHKEKKDTEFDELFNLGLKASKKWRGSTDAVEIIKSEREKQYNEIYDR